MSNQIDDFADFLAGITPEERTTLAGLRDGSLVAVPREPTEAMLQNTVDAAGTIRVLDFTTPAERAEPFLIARFTYRAMLAAAPEAPGRG